MTKLEMTCCAILTVCVMAITAHVLVLPSPNEEQRRRLCTSSHTHVPSKDENHERTLRRYEVQRPALRPRQDIRAGISSVRAGRDVRRGADEVPFQNDALDASRRGAEDVAHVSIADSCERLHQAILSRDAAAITACRARLLASGEQAVSDLTQLINCGVTQVEIEALRLLLQIRGNRAYF